MPPVPHISPAFRTRLRAALLAWYDAGARALPWRVGPRERAAGAAPDPYRVWLSEVMLQQTTTPHAAPYFLDFSRRWPAVGDLAAADDAEVMAAWAGLGYYARARNLLACARAVSADHGGRFPDTEAGLRALPGIGGYTAAAVAAIAFDRRANVVDGNIERVMARLFAVETPLPQAKPELAALAAALLQDERPGDWAQALMDLGATICRPTAPLCERCPIAADCQAAKVGDPQTWPRRTKKADRPRRWGDVYILRRDGDVALVRRPPKGLLGGMVALPTSTWLDAPPPRTSGPAQPPAAAPWRPMGEIDHGFTHFSLTLRVWRADTSEVGAFLWTPLAEAEASMPSLFAKALRHGLLSLL